MVKKKQGLSDAEYIDYYNHHHAQKAVPLLLRHGILSYSLVRPVGSRLTPQSHLLLDWLTNLFARPLHRHTIWNVTGN